MEVWQVRLIFFLVLGLLIFLVLFCLLWGRFYRWYHWNKVLTESQRQAIIRRANYKNYLLLSNPADLTDKELKHREAFIQEDILAAQQQQATAQTVSAINSSRPKSTTTTKFGNSYHSTTW